MKKVTSLLLATLLVCGALFAGAASAATPEPKETSETTAVNDTAASFVDVSGHWAKSAIDRWSSRGVINGVTSQKFEPERAITRAEWAALINRLFQYRQAAENPFKDVVAADWFANDVAVALGTGYMKGYTDGTFRPGANISREEAALTIAKLLSLPAATANASFHDAGKISSWALQGVASAASAGIITGYTDGDFKPARQVTRAEAASILDRAFNTYGIWTEEGVNGPAEGVQKQSGSVIVNSAGTTLQNMDIAGDLIIGKGVGNGDVYLKNVTVHGKTFVYGGGENSIHLEDSVILTVIVNKAEGTVRIVAQGKTTVQEITVQTGAKLEASEGADISKVTLSNQLPNNSRVVLTGHFDTVNVEAESIIVQIPKGSIDQMVVADSAAGTSVQADKEATIVNAVLNAAVKMLGEGTVEKAVVNSTGVSMDKAPNKMETGSNVPSDVKVNVGGKEQPAGTDTQGSIGGGDLGGGSAGGGSAGGNTGGGNTGGGNTGGDTGGGNTGGGDTGGGNTGGSNPGSMYFEIALAQDRVISGEPVTVTSTRDGVAYFTDEYFENTDMLNALVDAGKAKKMEVKKDVPASFDTSDLTFNNWMYVVVIDSEGKSSYHRMVTVLDKAGTPLASAGGGAETNFEWEKFRIEFNRDVKLVEGKDLRTAITVATKDSNDEFLPLSAGDVVEINGNEILYTPEKKFTLREVRFKIAAGTLETLNGDDQNDETISYQHDSYMLIKVDGERKNSMTVPVGTVIHFTATHGGTVYFVLDDTPGGNYEYEQEVNNNFGGKVVIPDDAVDQEYTFDTTGFQPGEDYMLVTEWGWRVTVHLTEAAK
ncbi:S-layer homology domain-containing protein [Paenibacillus sp. BK720]|uniref:S-layer homology domain-containing protein n=1 Tax=Paenibacillus sp. BK720 TaxID=2587092 RepID=UPI00141E00FE|nr:S-layer homology domain-containing protein [Paenibacillus sp. BK720]NIK67200.1 hypothetical protein [Paenibacillus sp. BK720]